MRRLLIAILAIGLLGTGADLLLLEHYEDAWQIAPLVLVALALVFLGWSVWTHGALAIAMLRATMAACIAAGALGFVLHFQSNREFRRRSTPASKDGRSSSPCCARRRRPRLRRRP